MKKLELKEMDKIAGGFWGSFCGTLTGLWGAGIIAVELAVVASIPGLNIVAGAAAVACGVYAIVND